MKTRLNGFEVCLSLAMFLVSFAYQSNAQYCSNTNGTIEQNGDRSSCSDWLDYAPLIPEHTPVRTIRIALHSMLKQDGTGNFQDNTADRNYLTGMINVVNGLYANWDPLTDGTSPYISDSRIKFELTHIYFHDENDNHWNFSSGSNMYQTYVTNNTALSTEEKTGTMHVFFSGCPTCSIGGIASGFGIFDSYISISGYYPHYQNNGPGSFSWGAPNNLAHELGHLLSLYHNFQGGSWGFQCDGCSDNDPAGGIPPCPQQGTSNNLMDYFPLGWNSTFPGLSQCQLGKIHYYLEGWAGGISDKLVVDWCQRDPNQDITITGTHEWHASKTLRGNLIIEPQATLTVACRLHLPEDGRIIVKPGGKLIVDGGHITNRCTEFWAGIELHGSNLHQQFPVNNPTYQGMVELKNGALIEHAREAITVAEPGVWNTFGGVVKVDDATFLNCRRSVGFGSYDSGLPNFSSFTKAKFIVDDDYRGGNDFYAHVSMWDVRGIRFRGCEFRNDQTTVTESEDLGVGILAIDANFSVDNVCTYPPCAIGDIEPPCNPAAGDNSSFVGLDHGIRATEGSKGRSFSVKNSYFENNVCGVYVNSVNSFQAVRNEFVMGSRNVSTGNNSLEPFWIGHRGIYTTSSNGFQIEENVFNDDPNVAVETEAIVVGYTEQHPDVVYRNTMNAVGHGIVGEGTCLDPSAPFQRGLTFSCTEINNNQERDYAYRVPPGDPDYNATVAADYCIRYNQGGHNKFTPQQNGMYDYYNWDNWNAPAAWITYAEESGLYGFSNNVNNNGGDSWFGVFHTPASNIPSCVSHVYCGGIEPVKGLFKQKAALAQADAQALNYVLAALIDGGDPEQLQNTVNSSWPQDAWDLRNALIAESPYLSVSTLFEVAEQNVLPDAMMLEVCLANPEATRQEGFLQFMEHEAPNTLPSSMILLIKNSWNTESYRGQLESALAEAVSEFTVANDRIISLMSNDTIIHPNDSLALYWAQGIDHASLYGLIKVHLNNKNFTEVETILNAMSDGSELSEKQINERDAMLNFVSTLSEIENSGRPMNDLGASEYDQLDQLAKGGYTRAAIMAQNLLCFHYGNCTPPRTGGQNGARSVLMLNSEGAGSVSSSLNAYPNPASTYVTLSFKLTDELNDAQLVLRDAQGKEIQSYPVADTEGQQLWDTRQIPPGIYLAELNNNGETVESQRIIIQ